MHEEIMYPVCPHRNVPAAFERFLGPDSGGIERFFPDERPRRADGTLVVVRLSSRKALASARHELHRAAMLWAQFPGVWLPRAMQFFASRPARLPA